MPSVDIKLGTSLVETFDGSPEKLITFINAVRLFSDMVDTEFETATAAQKAAAQVTLVRFVKTRLIGKARQVIGELDQLQEILNAIQLQCASRKTSDSILAKLKTVKQDSTVDKFCECVENLTMQLKSAYINEMIPQNRADQMATKRGVETLVSGIKNSDTKLILKAGTFEKIQDAVQKLQENEPVGETASVSQVFNIRSNYRGRKQGHKNYYGSNQNYSNTHHNNGYNKRGHNRGNRRGNSNYRGNFRGGNFQRNNYSQNHQMFYAQENPIQNTGNGQQQLNIPQQQLNQIPQQQLNQIPHQNFLHPQNNFLETVSQAARYTQ